MTLTAEGRQVAGEVLDHLRAAREPVREDVLHERMAMKVNPERFLELLEQLLTRGTISMHVDHDPPVNRPAPASPFELRYWYMTPR